MQLPNLLILGAAKAGTTSLYEILAAREGVYMSFVKEPMFFSRDDYYSRGTEWYAQTFFAGSEGFALRGEATPHYLYWADKVAARIRESLPDPDLKLVIILRDPVDRAYSWYWNMIKEGEEQLSFEAALAQEPARLKNNHEGLRSKGSMIFGYLKGSMYSGQIREFLKVFPREKLYFLIQEDLRSPESKPLQGLFDFLGLAPIGAGMAPKKSNPSTLPQSRTLQSWLRNPSAIKDVAKRLLPFRLRYSLKQYLMRGNTRSFDYPAMSPQTRAELRRELASEIAEQQLILGRDLSHWLAEEEKAQ
jgi:hypothetical protein